jgi:hypothetical protein
MASDSKEQSPGEIVEKKSLARPTVKSKVDSVLFGPLPAEWAATGEKEKEVRVFVSSKQRHHFSTTLVLYKRQRAPVGCDVGELVARERSVFSQLVHPPLKINRRLVALDRTTCRSLLRLRMAAAVSPSALRMITLWGVAAASS